MEKKLPSEDIILFNILPRLPAKSVLRFKSVSKQWYSFVNNPMFVNMHLQHQNNYKLLFISTKDTSEFETIYTFGTIECEVRDDGFTPPCSLPFDVPRYGNIRILSSFNGLVCVGITKDWLHDNFSDLVLWNPLTGDYKTLSKTNSHDECYQITKRPCLLYYNSIEDDYKFLCVTKSGYVYIDSLKSDSWREVESNEEYHRVSNYKMPYATPMDGKLYFLKEDNTIYPKTYSFMIFDSNTEKFTEIPAPFLTGFKWFKSFMVIRSCIQVWKFSFSYGPIIELWKLDGDWMKEATYNDRVRSLKPLHLMKNGNWLLINCVGDLSSADPEKRSILKPIILETVNLSMNVDLTKGKYIETFVSPNKYI